MSSKDLTLETASGVCTHSLVVAILESRRAYQLAMALARKVLLTEFPTAVEWSDDSLAAYVPQQPSLAWSRHSAKPRATELRFSMRKKTPRAGLRLVTPDHFNSPLVMPAGSSYPSTEKSTDEHTDDQRQLDAAEGRDPRDVG